ncbi:glycoside hydrolase family 3 protein [Tengunoibacter tsumagoiensis]|uniref:beta-N-acetylhexosaminidase n=1 Tax=Tengunoibacter tsumagoiensis TaxID=2014871 RepID=A0A402A1N6_9CHLR|nr:glycoside hydrolase family 3 N-terminal domain-containing protein [Tengunoibacter tsumagoiensis]GCE13070.1 hypothetical protein KTT_29290 [Tengunoibacter tsumagoiensis]
MEPTNSWPGKQQKPLVHLNRRRKPQFKPAFHLAMGDSDPQTAPEDDQKVGNPTTEKSALQEMTPSHAFTERETQKSPTVPLQSVVSQQPQIHTNQSLSQSALDPAQTILDTIDTQTTHALPLLPQTEPFQKPWPMSRGKAFFLISLLCLIVLQFFSTGANDFIGPRGWGIVLSGTQENTDKNLIKKITQQLQPQNGTPTTLTPQQYIDQIISRMSLDQKLGQMMLIQFIGPDYSLDLNAMISQYGVGAALIFTANQNVASKTQLTNLTRQMQQNAPIPMLLAIDQEGGKVDRLVTIDDPRPSAAKIAATGDPEQAKAAGMQDAQDLSQYGLNVNLAPVVDVDTSNASIIHTEYRAFGKTADEVTQMAGAYLNGLQQSGKVFGTLKHFPGLGHVNGDPHRQITHLSLSPDTLQQVDWAPYRNLIQQGNVHAIMVTHEFLTQIDTQLPSSLSSKIVQGILRDQMGFKGVIMTDSLTMDGITNLYTPGQAAALAIEAGSDLLMGASSPTALQQMIDGIKDAINAGTISQQRIDESVRRLLQMKYDLGLLPLPRQ